MARVVVRDVVLVSPLVAMVLLVCVPVLVRTVVAAWGVWEGDTREALSSEQRWAWYTIERCVLSG